MEIFDENFERINKYLRGRMVKEEHVSFEEELTRNFPLKEAVEKARLEIDVMEFFLEEDLRKQMASWSSKDSPINKNNSSSKMILFKWWHGLFVIVLTIGLFYYFNQQPDKGFLIPVKEQESTPKPPSIPIADKIEAEQSPSKIVPDKKTQKTKNKAESNASQYLAIAKSIYLPPVELKGNRNSSTKKDTLTLGIQLFTQKKYTEVIDLLEAYRNKKDDRTLGLAIEILAHAYFKNADFAKAEILFQSIVNKNTLVDEAQWYLLLCQVAQYPLQKEQMLESLKRISNDDLHEYQQDAVLLKIKLNTLQN